MLHCTCQGFGTKHHSPWFGMALFSFLDRLKTGKLSMELCVKFCCCCYTAVFLVSVDAEQMFEVTALEFSPIAGVRLHLNTSWWVRSLYFANMLAISLHASFYVYTEKNWYKINLRFSKLHTHQEKGDVELVQGSIQGQTSQYIFRGCPCAFLPLFLICGLWTKPTPTVTLVWKP